MYRLLWLLFGLIPWSIPGQGTLETAWFITRDGPQMAKDVAWGVDLDENGQIYWATSQTTFGGNRKDILTYQIDPMGNEVWNEPHQFGDNFEQQAYNCLLRNGILYVAGRTWPGPLIQSSDALLYALDIMTMDTLWSYVWDGGYGYEEVDGLVYDDNALYLSGWSWGETTNQDAFITKLDLNGNALWTTTWGSPNYDQCDGHCVVDDSTVYICGLYDLSASGDAYLAAFDKFTGHYKWHSLWGGPLVEDALGMNSDGVYLYQCGNTSSFGDSTVFINKYDKNGQLIWSRLTEKAVKTRSLAFAEDGTFYLAATSTTLGSGEDDLILMHYDSDSGSLLEYKTWGGTENEVVHDIRIKDNFMYLTGRTESFSDDADFDALLIKAPLFGVVGTAKANPYHKVLPAPFPNPFTDQVTFDLRGLPLKQYLIRVFDPIGKLVREIKCPTPDLVSLKRKNLPAGLYFWSLIQDGQTVSNGSIIAR